MSTGKNDKQVQTTLVVLECLDDGTNKVEGKLKGYKQGDEYKGRDEKLLKSHLAKKLVGSPSDWLKKKALLDAKADEKVKKLKAQEKAHKEKVEQEKQNKK